MTPELIIAIVVPVVSGLATIIAVVWAVGRKEGNTSARLEALDENTRALRELSQRFAMHEIAFAKLQAETAAWKESRDREIRDLKGGSGCFHSTNRGDHS